MPGSQCRHHLPYQPALHSTAFYSISWHCTVQCTAFYPTSRHYTVLPSTLYWTALDCTALFYCTAGLHPACTQGKGSLPYSTVRRHILLGDNYSIFYIRRYGFDSYPTLFLNCFFLRPFLVFRIYSSFIIQQKSVSKFKNLHMS